MEKHAQLDTRYFLPSNIPPALTKEESADLARKYRNGDESAKDKLVSGNLRLVVKIALGYQKSGVPMNDLVSDGCVGLMKAAETYDPDRAAFSTFAVYWISHYIRRAIPAKASHIRLPVHIAAAIAQITKFMARWESEHGEAPCTETIGEELKIPAWKVRKLLSYYPTYVSFDSPVAHGSSTCYADIIPDRNASEPSQSAEMSSDILAMNDIIAKILSERERTILRLRFGLDGQETMTLSEIGEKFDCTRERARQIQKEALEKLKKYITKKFPDLLPVQQT